MVYLLIIIIMIAFHYARSREHLRSPWRQVLRSKQGMASLVVLGFFAVMALIDSIHFHQALPNLKVAEPVRYSVELTSVLDWMGTGFKKRVEKTYSAPFATHSYMKENILVGGKQVRAFPRLDFAGRHLVSLDDKASDIFLSGLKGLMTALIVWFLLVWVIARALAGKNKESIASVVKKIVKQQYPVPWLVILAVIGVITLLASMFLFWSENYHVLGTDKVGNDVLFQALKSIRTGLLIGTLTTLVMLPFAILLGTAAGYFRGWVDDAIQYFYTTLNSIPGILLIVAALLTVDVYIAENPELINDATRADIRLLWLCIILGITSWTGLCRLLRGETLKLREVDYVTAASAFGVNEFTIIWRHIVPNVMHIVLIVVVLDFSGLVLAEAVLSYIGVGVDPTMDSWGNMINGARLEMAREPMVWWSLLAAFTFMFTLVLAANLFSDTVRDAFDPRLRRQ